MKQRIHLFPFRTQKLTGDNEAEDPPVPIPNTEVKLCVAESTIRDTVWEDRGLPDLLVSVIGFFLMII